MADIKRLRKQLIRKAKEQVKQRYSERDVHVVRAVSVLQDLDSAFNLLAEHVIEWHGSHFPELHLLERDNERYLLLVSRLGERKGFAEKKLAGIVKDKGKAGRIAAKAKQSMGSSISQPALLEIRALAENALGLRRERVSLEKFIEVEMNAISPNLGRVAGCVIGAKLIAAAGSLRNLALLPSSTIQLLGAEKALFRHLRNKMVKGPKHGLLYQHPMVKQVPARHKGKMARTLAGKLSIAARADYFGSKKKIAEQLEKGLEQRLQRLKK